MRAFGLKSLLLAAVALLAVLTFLFLKTQEVKLSEQENLRRALRRFKEVDAKLNQDVLKTRFGLLNNYDSFAEEADQFQNILSELGMFPIFMRTTERNELIGLRDELSKVVTSKIRLLEQFKSQNAVLNNSLRYFPQASAELLGRLRSQAENRELDNLCQDLLQNMLGYCLSSNEEALPEVERSVKSLSAWRERNPENPEVSFLGNMLAHAQALLSRKPQIDRLTREMLNVPLDSHSELYFQATERIFTNALNAASRYRLCLYLFCVLLVAGIGYTIFALHAANRNLDQRVRERTQALSQSNAELTNEVSERKRAEQALLEAQKQVAQQSRMAGMAEIATGVLHNVGNVLNSVNVSTNLLAQQIKKSRLAELKKLAGLLDEHAVDLPSFFAKDPRALKVPDFVRQLCLKSGQDQEASLQEIASLQNNVAHIKDIVAMQQSYATVSGVSEIVDLAELVEDTLRMSAASLARHDVQVIRELEKVPPITTDKHKVLQILVNLFQNAKQSCDEAKTPDKKL
ncbi:MAG TPA: DAHL domain-containing protein, partial [Verrucomicrobiae bacterium]